jgi:hypothetical protein
MNPFMCFLIFELCVAVLCIMYIDKLERGIYHLFNYLWMGMMTFIWIIHFGHKSFTLKYKHPDDEDDVYRIIEFPALRKK